MKLVNLCRERTLPYPGRISVEVGQKVDSNDNVAVLDYVPGNVYKVPVAKMLSLPYDKLDQVAIVEAGDQVEKGQVLAVNNVFYQPFVCTSPIKGIVGIISKQLGQMYLRDYIPLDNDAADDVVFDLNKIFSDVKRNIVTQNILVKPGSKVSPSQILAQVSMKRYVTSNIYGQVKSITDNRIVISAYKINSELKAYLPGEVMEIGGRNAVTIAGKVYQLQGVYGLGGERQGLLKAVDNKLDYQDLSSADTGKIIFAPDGVTLNALRKANELGVSAVITSNMPFLKVKEYAGIDFVPGITGGENITTGLMLVKGFVPQAIDQNVVDFVCHYDGEWVAMTGTTHIRAGALRPELILPVKDRRYPIDEYNEVIKEGSLVEVKRSGCLHGSKGRVKRILAKPVVLPSLIKVLAAVVEIDQHEHQVPLTNIMPAGGKNNG